MAYCLYTDIIIDVFPRDLIELIDDLKESTPQQPFSQNMINLINSFIAKADAIIDDYCRGKYDLPFNPVPETIKNLSVAISTYLIFSRPRDLDEYHPKRQKYEDAIRFLTLINQGHIILNVDPKPKVEDTIGVGINKNIEDRLFNKNVLSQMV